MRPQRSSAGKKRYNPEEYELDSSYKDCFDIFCSIHPKERIISICKESECDQQFSLICTLCTQNHKKHKTLQLNRFFKDVQHIDLKESKNFRKIFENIHRDIKDNIDKLESTLNQYEDLKEMKGEINKFFGKLEFLEKQSKIQKKHLKMIKNDQFFDLAEQDIDILKTNDPFSDMINLFAKTLYSIPLEKVEKEKCNNQSSIRIINQDTIIQKLNNLNTEIKSYINKINEKQSEKQQKGEQLKYGALLPLCQTIAHFNTTSTLLQNGEELVKEERKDVGLVGYINKEKFLTVGRNNQLKIWDINTLKCLYQIPFQLPANQSFHYAKKMNLAIINGHFLTKKGFSLVSLQQNKTSLKLMKHFNVRNHLFDSIMNSFIKNQKLLLIQRHGTKTHVGIFDVKRRKYIKQYLFNDQFNLSCCMQEIPSVIALASMKTNKFGFLNLLTGEEIMGIADDISKFAIYTIDPFRNIEGDLFFAISLTTNLTQNYLEAIDVYQFKLLIFKLDQVTNKWNLIYERLWDNHIVQIQYSRKLDGLLLLEGFDPKNYKHSNFQFNEVEIKMKQDERFSYFKLSLFDMNTQSIQTLLTQKNEIMCFLHNDLSGKTLLIQENSLMKVNKFNYDYVHKN